jgi:hypothetical protein
MINRLRKQENRAPTPAEIAAVTQQAAANSQALAGHGRKAHGRQLEAPTNRRAQQRSDDQQDAIARTIQMKRRDESRPATADDRPGLPDGVKSAVENLSGMSLDGVKVHYSSPEPAQLDALAFTQANDIHLGPGQERHLAHEAWHVVQQAKGRVKPTMQLKGGVQANDQQALEDEADAMGAAAMRRATERQGRRAAKSAAVRPLAEAPKLATASPSSQSPLQRYKIHGEERTISAVQMDEFDRRRKEEREQELTGRGFTMRAANAPERVLAYQPGPVMRGAMDLARSRFDTSGVDPQHQDPVERAISGGTGSSALNDVSMRVGMHLFGRMLRNVGRLRQDNWVRDLANIGGNPYSRPFTPRADPTRATDAESATLRIRTNAGVAPHYNHEENSVSLMMPEQMDQTGHELQHALDHLSGELDLSLPSHRLASEHNAFTRQHSVSSRLTGRPPANFEGRSPEQMARSYEGKESYPGTLDESQKAVEEWRKKRDKEK